MSRKINAGESRRINNSALHIPTVKKSYTKHIAVWDGKLESTAMLIIIMKNNYPLDYVLILPIQQMCFSNSNEIEFMKNYLKYNSIPYQEIGISKCSFLRINTKYWIDRIYRKMNCHIIQYVSDMETFCRTNLPNKYYITNQYPLIENNFDIVKCKQEVYDAGFLHNPNQNHLCKKTQDHLK